MTNTFVSCAAESGRADTFCFHSLYRAWQACRKRKRGTRNAQRYEIHLLDRLVDTRTALEARTWLPGRSVCFVTTRPKAWEIHAADVPQRHAACLVSATGCQEFFQHYRPHSVARPADTANRHPAENVVYRGDANVLASVPEYKRLSSAPPGKGLPIGNLTSQFFANVYLNELDQFVKHTLKCRCYVRYVDDFVLLHEDRERLLQWRWYKQQRPDDVVLVQRGNVFEAYD